VAECGLAFVHVFPYSQRPGTPAAGMPAVPPAVVRERITATPEQIAAFCQAHHIRWLALFGSVLRDDFRPDSDVDVLVTFVENAHWSLFDIVEMQDELKTIFGREVDIVEPDTISNPFRRRTILKDPEIIYAA